MIRDDDIPELSTFRRIEKKLPIQEKFEYTKFVDPKVNSESPVHTWFKYKESFSADLLKEILTILPVDLGKKFSLLDPFCGVGTSLLSAQELSASGFSVSATGIERNPFVAFVARTKLDWSLVDLGEFENVAGNVLSNLSRLSSGRIPPLSSLTTGRCISRYKSQKIVAIREFITESGNGPAHQVLLLGLASVIESVSNVRKDGRALRIVEKGATSIRDELSAVWARMAQDIKFLKQILPKPSMPQVRIGDGRKPLNHGVSQNSIDLVLTSPPYPNNIDYSEVYKLELWLLGFIKEPSEFLKLRKSTFRSHPTCAPMGRHNEFQKILQEGEFKKIVDPIIERTIENNEAWRGNLFSGYFYDLWMSLTHQFAVLKKGGCSVTVIGNSLHGTGGKAYLIPTDIIVAYLAEHVGFKVVDIVIAKPYKRRLSGNHFLRESIVIVQKP